MARIITIGGGKGGTGKSMVAVNIAYALSRKHRVMLVDADVESPIDHILLGAKRKRLHTVYGFIPRVNVDKCIGCGKCIDACPEHALVGVKGQPPKLVDALCEGCGICSLICPANAIMKGDRILGYIYRGARGDICLIQGELIPGVRQHVNVTLKTIDYALEDSREYDYIVIDSAPGTGAGVWVTLRYADVALAVTEPTPLGASDLERYLRLNSNLGKNVMVIINKSGIRGSVEDMVRSIARGFSAKVFEIPYDVVALEAYIKGRILLEWRPDSNASKGILQIVEALLSDDAYY